MISAWNRADNPKRGCLGKLPEKPSSAVSARRTAGPDNKSGDDEGEIREMPSPREVVRVSDDDDDEEEEEEED